MVCLFGSARRSSKATYSLIEALKPELEASNSELEAYGRVR